MNKYFTNQMCRLFSRRSLFRVVFIPVTRRVKGYTRFEPPQKQDRLFPIAKRHFSNIIIIIIIIMIITKGIVSHLHDLGMIQF